MHVESNLGIGEPLRLEQVVGLAKALADRSRLLVLNALREHPMCAEEVAALLSLAPSTTSFHLKKLAGAGLVTAHKDQYYTVYSINPYALAMSLADLVDFANPRAAAQEWRAAEARRTVLRAFFTDGRLVKMPVQNRKRQMVLQVFAGLFDPGRVYAEVEVDAAIREVHHDHCLVRRLLVDEGFMTRERGEYRRTGKPGLDPREMLSERLGQADKARPPRSGGTSVDQHRKALKKAYATQARQSGIFRVVNTKSGRELLGSSLDVRAALNRYRFELEQGSHRNHELQGDFSRSGADSFAFETVEIVDPASDPEEVERQLELLEARYSATLEPSRSYNSPGDLRVPPRRRHP